MFETSAHASDNATRKSLLNVSMAHLAPQLSPPVLSDAEEKLMLAVERGDFLTLGNEGDALSNAPSWEPDRVIRAGVLEWLCTDSLAREYVTHKGVLVIGARIDGILNLAYAQMPFPFWLRRCSIIDGMVLPGAEIKTLHLDGSMVGPIFADHAKFIDSVQMRNGFEARGEVRFLGAKIGADLDCVNSTFTNPGSVALDCNGIVVAGSVHLKAGFKANGEVWFNGADIGRNLDCDSGSFSNPGGYSLNLDSVKVRGNILLRNGYNSEGEVRLVAAAIGGNLECDSASFSNIAGYSLHLDSARIEGNVFMRDGFSSQGEASLVAASIGGNFECADASFKNNNRYALNCERISVNGSVALLGGFESEGKVQLALATVRASLIVRQVAKPEALNLDIRDTKVGILSDDPASWPPVGMLQVNGFTYEVLSDETTHDVGQRIDWLHRQPRNKSLSQPYEQLAKVLRAEGNEDGAIQVMIAKNRERQHYLGETRWGSMSHILLWLNGLLMDYGYRPWKPIPLVIAILLFGTTVFKIGWHLQLFAPTNRDAITGEVYTNTRAYDPLYPVFSAPIYSISTFAPLVNLYVEDYWLPDANASWNWCGRKWPLGAALRFYLWMHVIAGWGLTTIVVAGFTGLIKT